MMPTRAKSVRMTGNWNTKPNARMSAMISER
jgi:hypothetical protein